MRGNPANEKRTECPCVDGCGDLGAHHSLAWKVDGQQNHPPLIPLLALSPWRRQGEQKKKPICFVGKSSCGQVDMAQYRLGDCSRRQLGNTKESCHIFQLNIDIIRSQFIGCPV